MTKYLINRIIRALISVIIVVGVIMVMVYTFLDKNSIFAEDPVFNKQRLNGRETYMMQQWELFGYLDYISFSDYLKGELRDGNIDQETYDSVVKLGKTAEQDSEETAKYVAQFTEEMEEDGYTMRRLDGQTKPKSKKYKDGGDPRLFAYKDIPLSKRLLTYFTKLIQIDNINYAAGDVGERGLTFTWRDPAYGGQKFSPAIMGNGTMHKYLLYCDNQFPFIHQNLITINLGKSFSVNRGIDVFSTMTDKQGGFYRSTITYPSGVVEETADDIHSLSYVESSLNASALNEKYYVDDYTSVITARNGLSKMGYSFVIGIISVIMAYMLATSLVILMALNKEKFIDKLGTFYIVFIMAVPSLGYIFIFRAIGNKFGLPTTFNMEAPTTLMYILPIISLALPSIANQMKWLRRYMIDQMNSDYVKFARSGGLSEGEIFSKHILKNAIIPVVHGIPGSVLGALTGAIITERVYLVPGIGNVLTTAINKYDNGVIVGVALFYALLSVTSFILGDVLMSILDPRISFSSKAR
mgnify:CR=1 FL=1